MSFRILSGFDSYPYLETLAGTARWGYSHGPLGIDADDIPLHQLDFEGTDLYLIDRETETLYQPFPQEKLVYLEKPVYDPKEDCFGLIRHDFKTGMTQVYTYSPLEQKLSLLTQLPMEELGDLINIRLAMRPWALVKHDMQEDRVHFFWPFKASYQWEENESLDFMDETYFYTSKWIEDPDYYEEVRLRDRKIGEIQQTFIGSLHLTQDEDFLILTSSDKANIP